MRGGDRRSFQQAGELVENLRHGRHDFDAFTT
jgi:hypothetical protein